jgi:hypothetical protein
MEKEARSLLHTTVTTIKAIKKFYRLFPTVIVGKTDKMKKLRVFWR